MSRLRISVGHGYIWVRLTINFAHIILSLELSPSQTAFRADRKSADRLTRQLGARAAARPLVVRRRSRKLYSPNDIRLDPNSDRSSTVGSLAPISEHTREISQIPMPYA